jgi:hypothetical protein
MSLSVFTRLTDQDRCGVLQRAQQLENPYIHFAGRPVAPWNDEPFYGKNERQIT